MQINEGTISNTPIATTPRRSNYEDQTGPSIFSTVVTRSFPWDEDVSAGQKKFSYSSGAHELFRNLTGYNVIFGHDEYYFHDDEGKQPTTAETKMLEQCAEVFQTAEREGYDGVRFFLNVDQITDAIRKIVNEFDPNSETFEQMRDTSQSGADDNDVLDLLSKVLDKESPEVD